MYSQNNKRPLSRLAASIALVFSTCAMSSAYALESITDQAMSDVTGADGVAINIGADQVQFGSLYWQDSINQTGATGNLTFANTVLTNGVGSTSPIAAVVKINTGSSSNKPALSMNLSINSSLLFTAPTITICTTLSTCTSPTSLGSLAVQTTNPANSANPTTVIAQPSTLTNPTNVSITTTNGFLNSSGTASVKLLLDSANIFFTSNGNQIVTSDIRANINATGRIWVDTADGFRFSTMDGSGSSIPDSLGHTGVSLAAASDSRAGLQAALMMQNSTGNTLASSTPTGTNTPPNGLIRFGVSGNLPKLDLYLRGSAGASDSAANGGEDNIGNVVGKSGISARMIATIQSGTTLSHDGNNTGSGFELELGAAGLNGYGIRMSNFVPFSNVMGTNPTIDTGNVYLNLVNASSLTMPVPLGLTSGKGAMGVVSSSAHNFGLSTVDTQNISNITPTSAAKTDNLLFAVRGLSIQGVSLKTSFYQNGVGACTGTTTCAGSGAVTGFAVIPVLYGVSANLALNANTGSATPSLGYSLALAMSGNNGGTTETGNTPATDIKESAFFLANTGTQNNAQYIGLRDINLYFKANGVITFKGSTNGVTHISTNNINITMPNFLFALSANFAAGYLPGTENTGLTNGSTRSGYSSFASNKDTISTIDLSLQSDATNYKDNMVDVITSSAFNTPTSSFLGLNADLTLKGTTGSCSTLTPVGSTCSGVKTNGVPDQSLATNNFIHIAEPGTGAAFGLDRITGRIQLGSGSGISVGSNSGTLTANLIVNPQNIQGNELLANINLYDGTLAAPQSLGKMVITGGQLLGSMTLKPCTITGTGASFSCI
ncbi:MAG: hypothetical protein H7Z73_10955 [Candidatus Saccharibacteria bacterium]|nr:hypothetical protein [Moraxellaceae bacterium]